MENQKQDIKTSVTYEELDINKKDIFAIFC